MIQNRMRPVHPGEILREDFLAPLGLSVNALAQALRVPATRLHEIVNGGAVSHPTRPCGSPATSAAMRSHGSTCKPPMT